MTKTMSKTLIQKHVEMRNLKHEELAITDLLAKVNDQINRLSVGCSLNYYRFYMMVFFIISKFIFFFRLKI
jgi:hypothetical protein